MNELNEITAGKNLEALETELRFQLANGEPPGGAIVSHIQGCINRAKLTAPGTIFAVAGRCIHFTGLMNKTCKAGISYGDVRVTTEGRPHKIPCLLGPVIHGGSCASCQFPTREQVEQTEALIKQAGASAITARAAIVDHLQSTKQSTAVITCPICQAKTLHYYRSKSNGHIRASCATPYCIAFVE